MSPQALADLARSDRLQDLEQAWERGLTSPGEVADYEEVLRSLCEQSMTAKALSLGSVMVDALAEAGRRADALRLALALVALGAYSEALGKRTAELLRQEYGHHDWFPLIESRARLAGSPSPEALATAERLLRYTPGNVVYHAAGWNEGLVEGLDAQTAEAKVRFASGRRMDLPLDTLLDTCKPLDAEDLRAMRLTAPEKLAELAKDQPSVLIRKAARVLRGRITSSQLKDALCPSVLPTSKWASYWKRAKAAATVDPWLQIEGSKTRPTFELRKRPLGLIDEARRMIDFAEDLGDALEVCRDHLQRCEDPAMREQLLDIAEERVRGALQNRASHAAHHLADGVLMLEAAGRSLGENSAAAELRALLLDDSGQVEPEHLDKLSDKTAAVGLLESALGEGWYETLGSLLPRLPMSVVEPTIELLRERGHAAQVLATWSQIAPYPSRHPAMTYHIGRLYADGAFDSIAERPTPTAMVRVLLHLARVLAADRRGSVHKARLLTRTASLLTGRRSFLAGVLEEVERDVLRDFLGIAERGGSDFPPEITTAVLRVVARRFPDLTATPDRPFWEEDHIYVTSAGLARQREEYRKLVDEKIPANSAAIGAAASLGDLSENSEWESAMEEQRNLTSRAQEMDQEIRKARLIEEQDIPDDVVAPGTRVVLEPIGGGAEQAWRVLGPWDAQEDDVISYRAPLAQELLGKQVDETVDVLTPGGERTMRIKSIERVV